MLLTATDIIYCLIRLAGGFALMYQFGLLYGLILFSLSFWVFNTIVSLLPGWEPLAVMDSIFMLDNPKNMANMMIPLIWERFDDPDNVKKFVLEKLFQFRRVRCLRQKFFGLYFM